MTLKQPTAGIILAAGMSTRLGRPKQLLPLKGKPLLEWVLDAALNSRLENLVLVLGYKHQEILQALGPKARHPRLNIAINRQYRQGLSCSLRVGILAAGKAFASVMFLLADQPMVDSATIDHLLDRFRESDKDICVPIFQGKRGNPTLFSQKFFSNLLNLTGDTGGRDIIQANPERTLYTEVGNPLGFYDIDTEEDLMTLQSFLQ